MRVRLEKYQSVHGSLRWRSLVLLALGAIGVVIFSFGAVLGLLMVLIEGKDPAQRPIGIFLGLFVGVLPLGGSLVILWRGTVGRRRLLRLRELAALARARPIFGPSDVSMTLSLNPIDTERLLLDAASLGLVEEGPMPPGYPPAPAYSSPPGYVPPPSYPPPGPYAQMSPAASPSPSPMAAQPVVSGVRQVVASPQAFAATQAAPSPYPPPQAGAPPGGGPPYPAQPARPAPPPATVFQPGEILNGTYRVEAVLGSGGMGLVYAARHVRTGRRYAVKTLLPDAQLSPDAIRRFEREATAASALGHPGIVAVHDFHETPAGVHYLVMDLLEGETLEQRLARAGCLPWPEARRIALEVGAALSAAHDRGLLHRDLKPANIFLARATGAPERAVLLDFGLAKPLSDAAESKITVSGAAVGTPLYMSPEQARGEALDVRSDVYGLGAVIYEMITGAPPFLDRTLAGVYARLLTESAPAATSAARYPCPAAVDDILACTLAKTPAERFASMRALIAALEAVGAAAQRSA